MKLVNIKEVDAFLAAVDACKGDVWLEDRAGSKLSLKSSFSRYIAMGNLLQDKAGELELFCANSGDEGNFVRLFEANPQILAG